MNEKKKTKLVQLFLFLTVLFFFGEFFLGTLGFRIPLKIEFLIFLLPLVTLLFHSSIVFTFKKTLLLFLLSSLLGLLFEIVGVRSGVVFGGHYAYQREQFDFFFFGVPLLVPVFWSVFIYIGYSLTTSFLTYLGKDKPSLRGGNLLLLPLLVILDGLVVVTIDLFMDPVMVYQKKWLWEEGGLYFGIPMGNFIGWFMVTVLVTGIFRTVEYFRPREDRRCKGIIRFVPGFAYFLIWFFLLTCCWQAQLFQLALVGTLVMLPVVFVNLFCLAREKKS
ncbi:MAG: carotenoid biosynthesis protein [Patescibacteria group bacterium]